MSASGQSSYSDQKPYYVFNKSNGSWTGQDSAPGTSCYLQISGIDPSLYPEIGTIEYNTTQKTIPFVIQGFTGSEWVDLSEQKSCSPGSNRIDFIKADLHHLECNDKYLEHHSLKYDRDR